MRVSDLDLIESTLRDDVELAGDFLSVVSEHSIPVDTQPASTVRKALDELLDEIIEPIQSELSDFYNYDSGDYPDDDYWFYSENIEHEEDLIDYLFKDWWGEVNEKFKRILSTEDDLWVVYEDVCDMVGDEFEGYPAQSDPCYLAEDLAGSVHGEESNMLGGVGGIYNNLSKWYGG